MLWWNRLAGGLAWLGLLLFGVVSEQVKTRLEDRTAEQDTKVGCSTPLLPLPSSCIPVAVGL